ncbi:Excinuclease ABC subunit C [Psychromonas ingrahamii 37]|uniref:UvrABC system protein C n=1 Tax=Psychromonas ingrahamii (strain DSM 17664 / CCUG 51855 / 37) TaxID=357804 RepID=A1SU62_PSYIN|nr:excinuclease ABC subunit UvrC [Psychromonas ingrahamii]ABM03027.1 Excinuclease ABC subunit C [Psychromonas ingrahamii 37]
MSDFCPTDFLKTVTSEPGVYRMFNQQKVIYVGKAKNLKKRLSSYFSLTQKHPKTLALVSHIDRIEVTVTHTETEALILEHNFIKRYKPHYNVLLRDDKSYPYLFLSDHKHPQLTLVRTQNSKRKGTYFGPYPSGGAVRESLHLMQKLFPIRQCEDSYYSNRSRPCLQYQLKRCLAPCVNAMPESEYQHQVELASAFLQGKSQNVINQLVDEMEVASQTLEFEKAAVRRDQIQSLKKVQEQQWVSGDIEQLDVVGFSYEQGFASIHLLFVRQGRILGSRNYFPKIPKNSSKDEVLSAFLSQFYLSGQNGRAIPREILLSDDFAERAIFTDLFTEYCGYKTALKVDVRGERARFVKLAQKNAQIALQSHLSQKNNILKRYQLLEAKLDLSKPILRMECYDISHMMGEKTVASCVVFNREGEKKSDYRRFNITGITPGDDYAAMGQVLARRFKALQETENIPDIIFIDGGVGQLNQAENIISSLEENFKDKYPLLIGIAKGEGRKPGLETLILAGTHEIIELSSDSPALHLIQQIRDESHRFAIMGHRQQRDKTRRTSTLENISGVGTKRRQALLNHLGGLQGVMSASIDELQKIPGISASLAETIYEALHN